MNKVRIVSDELGLVLEGVETVKTAVRQAREANVFLVFVGLDNPVNKVMTILYFSDPYIWHIDFYLSS